MYVNEFFEMCLFIWVGVLPACVSVHLLFAVTPESKRGHQILLEMELQTVVSHHMDAWE